MRNNHVEITRGDQTIYLVGVDDPHTGRDNIEAAMEDVPDKAAAVLLAHSPTIFPQAVERGIDLVLCGHTHGGQVRLPFVGALIVPGQGLFPEWDHGMFREDETIMLINDGLGGKRVAHPFPYKTGNRVCYPANPGRMSVVRKNNRQY